MFKQIATVAALIFGAFVSTTAANAEVVRCRTSPNGWCEMRPAMGPQYNNRRPSVGMPVTQPRQVEEYNGQRAVTGPKMGIGAEDFQVSGIREGEDFNGVSNPIAAVRCAENGGHLVVHFAEVMPNGQSRYNNTCEPR